LTIIVSDDDEDADYSPFSFLNESVKDDVLNIAHDYRYQKMAYYVSMHAEMCGCHVTPSVTDILDTHRNPLLIARAAKAGIPCMTSRLVTEYEKGLYPSVLFAVNPYTCNSVSPVTGKYQAMNTIKSLSVGYKFPVSVQPLKSKIFEAVEIFGHTTNKDAQELTSKFYEEFHIPIGKILYQIEDGVPKLSHFEPCTVKEVDWKLVKEMIRSNIYKSINK